MSNTSLNLTIYGTSNIFSHKDNDKIRELILKTLAYAPIIITKTDPNDVNVMLNKLDSEMTHRNAEYEQIKEFFNTDLIYNSIKSINFQFESNTTDNSQISFHLYPIYGDKIDQDYQKQNTQLKDLRIFGNLTLNEGEYGALDPHFFELAKTIIETHITQRMSQNYIIDFQGSEEKSTIMEPKEFLDKIEDLINRYCENPDFEK